MSRNLNLALCVIALALPAIASAEAFLVNKASSEVAVDVRASPPHNFSCVLQDYAYQIEIDPATLGVQRAEFSFSFSDLVSDNAKRDKKMLRWIDIDTYPDASFSLSEVVQRDGKSIGIGSFTMHGVSKAIEIPFSVTKEGYSIVLDGEVTIDYTNWDLEIIRLFYVLTVDREIVPRFRLVGTLAEGGAE